VKAILSLLTILVFVLLLGSPVRGEQDLRITFGGFVENHPEGGKLGGVCGTDDTRNVLNCDIYNGLLDWTVTEITLLVTWSPYGDDDKRYYRVPVSIEPLKTERVSVRLGLQLPPDDRWGFQIMSARGSTARRAP
jgi:hypothetical protein